MTTKNEFSGTVGPTPAAYDVKVFHLAVLRAALEGVPAATYFGSTAQLRFWVGETRDLGLIETEQSATDVGRRLAAALDLSGRGIGRAYLWSGGDALEAAANRFMSERGLIG